MSNNKKYYYLKLKDNFFEQDSIKILESLENGHVYSLIILKLYLKACRYEGQLRMTPLIPYTTDDVQTLASVINHDVDHVKQAITNGVKLGLITVLDTNEIWMTEIQNFIGHSSTEADRIRAYRAKINDKQFITTQNNNESVQMYDKSTPEIEIEIDIDIEKEIEIKKETTEIKINFDNIRSFFKSLNPSYYHNGKQSKAIKELIDRFSEWPYFVKLVKHYEKMLRRPEKFWRAQPMTPHAFNSLVDRVEKDLSGHKMREFKEWNEDEY